jgi:hypothetical protein
VAGSEKREIRWKREGVGGGGRVAAQQFVNVFHHNTYSKNHVPTQKCTETAVRLKKVAIRSQSSLSRNNMSLIPHRLLFRVAHPCLYVKDMPQSEADDLLALPEACRLDNFAAMDDRTNFADFRIAWNEHGLGVQVAVSGKENPPRGDVARPRQSDGVTVWIDTRDARASHRATRYCHQFHLLAAGGGREKEDAALLQSPIHRALQDAPNNLDSSVPFRAVRKASGYKVEAFLTAAVLYGFDPEQNLRLGIYYSVHDAELGDQVLSVGSDFPYSEDPSLWSVLELVK